MFKHLKEAMQSKQTNMFNVSSLSYHFEDAMAVLLK